MNPNEEYKKETDELIDEISNFSDSDYDYLDDIGEDEINKVEEINNRLNNLNKKLREVLETIAIKIKNSQDINLYIQKRLKQQPYLANGEIPNKFIEKSKIDTDIIREFRQLLIPLNRGWEASTRFLKAFHQYYTKTKERLTNLPKEYPYTGCCPAQDNQKYLTEILTYVKAHCIFYTKRETSYKIQGIEPIKDTYPKYINLYNLMCDEHKKKFETKLKDLKIPQTLIEWKIAYTTKEPITKYQEIIKQIESIINESNQDQKETSETTSEKT